MPTETVIIEWVEEGERPARSKPWLWTVGLIGLGLVLIALGLSNLLFALIVALATAVIVISGTRTQAGSRYGVSTAGLIIDEQLYPFSNLHSFSIEERAGSHRLKVRAGRVFLPFLTIPLQDEEHGETVRTVLLDFLEEARHDETLVEAISDWLDF